MAQARAEDRPNDSSALGDSPLITPRKEEDGEGAADSRPSQSANPSRLMQAMTQAIQNPTAVRATANAEEDTKKRGWQERLEDLKAKK